MLQNFIRFCTACEDKKQWSQTNAHILTHTSNAKCFRNVTLINKQDLAEINVPVRGYGRHSPNQVMNKWEKLTNEVILSFS